MELEQAIRTRRTVKAFDPEPVDRATLDELLELARWAPNHNLTNPWRFRVVGPQALAGLKEAAADVAVRSAPPDADAGEIARVAAGYWRTPGVLRTQAGRAAAGIPDGEHFVGLLHLGRAKQEGSAPVREAPERYITYLD